MAHSHHGDDSANSSYQLDQLWTIATCGALGIVMVLLWHYNVLAIFLDSKFHDPVLWGGIALLVLVAIRAVSLWTSRPSAHAHDCDHDHGDCTDHDHHHAAEHAHAHDHDHSGADEDSVAAHADCGHDHGAAFWRYGFLVLPVALFLVKVPWPEPPDEPAQAGIMPLKLAEVEASAATPDSRAYWTERMKSNSVRLKGKLATPYAGDRRFGFVRLRMTCCFADAYGEPVKILLESPDSLNFDQLKSKGGWVRVMGTLEFAKSANGDEFIPIVKVKQAQAINTPSNQFDN